MLAGMRCFCHLEPCHVPINVLFRIYSLYFLYVTRKARPRKIPFKNIETLTNGQPKSPTLWNKHTKQILFFNGL